MANSLETRLPFLDPDVFEFAMSIPNHEKLHNGQTKYLLREWMREQLTVAITDAPKQGFGAPIESWLRNDLQERTRDMFNGDAALYQYLDKTAVRKTISDFFTCSNTDWRQPHQVWILFSLEMWFQKHHPRT